MAPGLESDRVDRRVDLRNTQDLLDLVLRVALGHVDRLASEAARLREPLGDQISDDHNRGTE
jgi:hypothetical protein